MQSLQINKNKCLESYSSKHKSRILHQTLSSTVSVDPLYVYVQAYILKFHAPVKNKFIKGFYLFIIVKDFFFFF